MKASDIMDNINNLWSKNYSKTLLIEQARIELMKKRDRKTRLANPKATFTSDKPARLHSMEHYANKVEDYFKANKGKPMRPIEIANGIGEFSYTMVGTAIRFLCAKDAPITVKQKHGGRKYYTYGR